MAATTATPSNDAFRHLIVCANPSTGSFDHAVTEAYAAAVQERGHKPDVHDLYATGFDPVLKADERPAASDWRPSPDVLAQLERVNAADMLILVYPIWYGLPPAMLKGYVDRILGANHSFHALAEERPQASLADKPLLSFSTSGLPQAWLHERNQDASLRATFDVYLRRAFGMRQSQHVAMDMIVPGMRAEYAASQLEQVRHAAQRACDLLEGKPDLRWEA